MDDARLLTLRDRYEAGQFTTGLAFQPNRRQSFLRYCWHTGRFEHVPVYWLTYGLNADGAQDTPPCEQSSSEKSVLRMANCRVDWRELPAWVTT